MIIKLSPQVTLSGQPQIPTIVKDGDALIINGETFDFSAVTEGEPLGQDDIGSEWIRRDVERIGGELVVTVLLPIGINASEAQCFPADILASEDGPVALPA